MMPSEVDSQSAREHCRFGPAALDSCPNGRASLSNPTQVLANGNYRILVAQGRQNCEQYLLGAGCGAANPNPFGGPLLELNADSRSELLQFSCGKQLQQYPQHSEVL